MFEGEPVSFECDSQGNTKWFFVALSNNALLDIPFNAHVTSNTLYIDYVRKINEGVYECQGELDEYYKDTYDKVKFAARAVLTGMLQQLINMLKLGSSACHINNTYFCGSILMAYC